MQKVEETVFQMIATPIKNVNRIGGGLNSKSYQLVAQDDRTFFMKYYFQHQQDMRDRLGTEYNSLKFLAQRGITCIPKPYAMDRENACALYEFVDGQTPQPETLPEEDVRVFIRFFSDLKDLKERAIEQNFGPASEACFSLSALVNNIQVRQERLLNLKKTSDLYQDLRDFLLNDMKPFFDEIIVRARKGAALHGIPFSQEISFEQKTLSASDIGFHNTIRRPNGEIAFIDFEYFGWDDPAKTISDFLLHPHESMQIAKKLRRMFAHGILDLFSDDQELRERVKLVYPFYGLKWCMILLNEFIPGDLKRRAFAHPSGLTREGRQSWQLDKSKAMLENVKSDYKELQL